MSPTHQPVMDMEIRPKEPEPRGGQLSLAAMIERVVTDPTVDVSKLEKVIELHERAQARFAQEQFNAAMSAAQTEMRRVATDADNPQTRSRYASYAALDRAIRPIYTTHGFGLSFNTGDAPLPEYVRVLCDVSHVGGHSKTYHVDMPADGKGAKGGDVMTKTHATGAALSYGMRYLLKMIFNVAVGEDDRDGNGPTTKPAAAEPAGYAKWFTELELTAPNGLAALQVEFQKGARPFREYLTGHDSARWADVKDKARKVKP